MYRYKVIIDTYSNVTIKDSIIRKEYYVIDLSDFNQMVVDKAQENLRKLGKQLLLKARLEFEDFKSKCLEYETAINIKPKDINSLKSILGKIAIIRQESHQMQNTMYIIRERIRTFFLYLNYNYLLENDRDKDLIETMLEIKKIYKRWSDIVDKTYQKQEDMKEDNKVFSNQTMEKDADFRKKIEEFHKEFMKKGPHSREVTIEQGLELFEMYSIKLSQMKEIKEQIIKDQKLFDLNISKYDLLSEVEERISFISKIYDIFKTNKTKMDELKTKLWKELNTKELKDLSEIVPKMVKKLRNKN